MGIKWLSLASSLYFFLLMSSAAIAAEPASLEQPSTLLAARVSLVILICNLVLKSMDA